MILLPLNHLVVKWARPANNIIAIFFLIQHQPQLLNAKLNTPTIRESKAELKENLADTGNASHA